MTVPRLSLLKDQLLSGFSSLSGSPPELYKAYILKFLDSYCYFSFSIIFTLFLSEDFGFSDVSAGAIYGACTLLPFSLFVYKENSLVHSSVGFDPSTKLFVSVNHTLPTSLVVY